GVRNGIRRDDGRLVGARGVAVGQAKVAARGQTSVADVQLVDRRRRVAGQVDTECLTGAGVHAVINGLATRQAADGRGTGGEFLGVRLAGRGAHGRVVGAIVLGHL